MRISREKGDKGLRDDVDKFRVTLGSTRIDEIGYLLTADTDEGMVRLHPWKTGLKERVMQMDETGARPVLWTRYGIVRIQRVV